MAVYALLRFRPRQRRSAPSAIRFFLVFRRSAVSAVPVVVAVPTVAQCRFHIVQLCSTQLRVHC
jgi:hypothetical protein